MKRTSFSLRRAVYPGSFDPVTNGHLDVIRRARKLYPEFVVGVAVHPGKETLFPVAERVAMLQETLRGLSSVRVVPFEGLVVHFARRQGACVIIRGLRTLSDFEYEFQMALTNRKLSPSLETIFMMTSEEHSYLSSRLIKEAAALGADLTKFVPSPVAKRLKERWAA